MIKIVFIFFGGLLAYWLVWEMLALIGVLLVYKVLRSQISCTIELFHSKSSNLMPVLDRCESLKGTYRPPIYLFNGFLQGVFGMTFGSRLGHTVFCESVKYTREYLTLPDNGEISIDWVHSENSKIILIIAPGLGSSSESQSARSAALEALKKGMTVAIVHGRGVLCKIKVISN